MMTLSWFQLPPRALGASARTVTGPPDPATFFKWPSAKNPMDLLSADQNGNEAPLLPSILLATSSLRACTHKKVPSFGFRAENAMADPSAPSLEGRKNRR